MNCFNSEFEKEKERFYDLAFKNRKDNELFFRNPKEERRIQNLKKKRKDFMT